MKVFKMYVKEGCPYCDKARDLILNDLQSSLFSVDVKHNPSLHRAVMDETGHKTVPAIYFGNEFIGGCDDLVSLSKSEAFLVKVLREEVNILRKEVIRLRRSLDV